MKKKSIFKRLSSLLIVMLMAVSVFSDGLVSFAADSKNTEHILYGWGYNFSNSGLANAYDPLTGETMPLITNGRRSFSIGQTATETTVTAYS